MFKIKKILIALAALFLIFPAAAGAEGFDIGSITGLGLPAGSVYSIIYNIMLWILGLFAFFGIIGFVVAGIMYLVSAGNEEMIGKAKTYMMYSIIGVVVGLMGFVIIQAVSVMLGASNTQF